MPQQEHRACTRHSKNIGRRNLQCFALDQDVLALWRDLRDGKELRAKDVEYLDTTHVHTQRMSATSRHDTCSYTENEGNVETRHMFIHRV